ncbi:MAG: hypothetical protein R3C18_00760 [Planctomycetaceae bacterium]
MSVLLPKIAILDSSNLGKAAADFWNAQASRRKRCHDFISRLSDANVFIAFTMTHVTELLRHENDRVVRDRIAFLGELPHIAWLRPQSRERFPSDVVCLFARELEAFVRHGCRDHRSIVEHIRPSLWETGTGKEMFGTKSEMWDVLSSVARSMLEHDKYVASICRADFGVRNLTIGECRRRSPQFPDGWEGFIQEMVKDLETQLVDHGDSRLEDHRGASEQFTSETLKILQECQRLKGDWILNLADNQGIDRDLISDNTTVSEFGALVAYNLQLKLFAKNSGLDDVSVKGVPLGSLPGYTLGTRLELLQNREQRISGSNLGDARIAALGLYADALEADKRTVNHLSVLLRKEHAFCDLMCPYFKVSTYHEIPTHIASKCA